MFRSKRSAARHRWLLLPFPWLLRHLSLLLLLRQPLRHLPPLLPLRLRLLLPLPSLLPQPVRKS